MNSNLRFFYKQQGVSLIEIMIAISILSIIMFIGVPSFQNFFERSRANAASESLVSAIQLARSEALRRGTNVTLCARQEAAGGAVTCSPNATWSDGWLVVDNANNVIRDWRLRGDVNVAIFSNAVAINRIVYNSRGMLDRTVHLHDIVLSVAGDTDQAKGFQMRRTGVLTK